MNKFELLKTIGFSDSFISELRNIEQNQENDFDPVDEVYQKPSFDLTNIIVKGSINSFDTNYAIINNSF
jgi:hypothetical protein